MKKVDHIKVTEGMKVSELADAMSKSGVMGAGRMARACNIASKMVADKDCVVFLGLAGAMVPGGMKDILIGLVENRMIDVLVTTGANLTHDLVEALGYYHFQGCATTDDAELHKKNIDRIYDSFMPNEVYEGMEDFFDEKVFPSLPEESISIKDFLNMIGGLLPKGHPSILKACHDNNIPIYCPALSDSGIGLMVWGHIAKGKKVDIQAFEDLKDILDITWTCKKAGFIYLGGGVPKNHVQQALQFSKGASYGVQVTMDRPEPGGSSGAELREGISWGKMNTKGMFVDLISDVTIALPVIYACLLDNTNANNSKKE